MISIQFNSIAIKSRECTVQGSVGGQLVRPNFANLFWVPDIVLDIMQLVKWPNGRLLL